MNELSENHVLGTIIKPNYELPWVALDPTAWKQLGAELGDCLIVETDDELMRGEVAHDDARGLFVRLAARTDWYGRARVRRPRI